MHRNTRKMLARLESLENGDGLKKAAFMARILWFIGLALFLFVGFGIRFSAHPIAVAIAAAAMGYVIAETNALRWRMTLWPAFKPYIDWQRVHEDLRGRDDTP